MLGFISTPFNRERKVLKSFLVKTSIFIVVAYVAITAFMYLLQRDLVFKPNPLTPDPAEYALSNVEIKTIVTEDKLKLKGWMLHSGVEGAPIIIFFHGNSGHIGHRIYKAKYMLEAGYDVFMAGYRGYGGNPGSPSEADLTKDAHAWMAWISQRASLDQKPLIIYGESLGSGIAVKMAQKYPARALILDAPYSSLVDVAQDRYPILPVKYLMKDPFYSDQIVANISTPVLIAHGTKDTVIPIELGQKLFKTANEPKRFIEIKGGRHDDLYDYNVFRDIDFFIKEHIQRY